MSAVTPEDAPGPEQLWGLDRVYLALTDSEAKELRDGVHGLVKTREKSWHVHVVDERFCPADARECLEREVAVYGSDDETASF